jgi:hypothetical protein
VIDLKILEKKGITVDALRTKLAGNPLTWQYTDGRVALWQRIRSRIQEGMNRNFMDYRIYHALDLAWETPFRQVSSTLLAYFIEKGDTMDDKVAEKVAADLGLTHMLEQELDVRTGKPTGKSTFNLPMFFNIFVPLVRAYVTIRWARIMNDRRLSPFFEYVPVKATAVNRLKCGAITDRVQLISNQYGYYDVMKQAVLKMLHYGWCLQFPKESWHSETQLKGADSVDKEAGESDELGKVIEWTTREGLRYHHPHPTRMYSDLNHGRYTYNYDSGCEFAGYWMIRRYRDIARSDFWNKEQISIGPNSLVVDYRTFFATVYSACTLNIPTIPAPKNDGNTLLAQVGAGIGDMDREKQLAYLYYGTDHFDQGCLTVEHFEKLVPSENGLGDYDHPVWFRFVVGGDIATFLYAEPLPYNPVLYLGYDADESRTNNASLSLEILPFQDHFSNVLTQIVLTAKQNLANVTFIDSDQVPEETRNIIANLGEKLFRKLNFVKFSGRGAVRAQNKVQEAVINHALPKGNVAELTNVLKTILDVLERVLVMSSQEVAQSASHEQTREEVRNIAQSTSTRLLFTSTPVDIFRDAWKRQLYQGLMAYGDEDIYAHIASDLPLTKEALEKMGFTFADEHDDMSEGYYPGIHHRRIKVKKQATAIELWEIASTRDGDDRPNDAQTAQVLAQLVQPLLANPMTAQAIGAAQAIELANKIGQLAGLDRDFKLRDMTPQGANPQEQQQAAQDQLQQVIQAVQQGGQQLQALGQQVDKNSQDIATLAKTLMSAPNPANDPLGVPAVAGGPS